MPEPALLMTPAKVVSVLSVPTVRVLPAAPLFVTMPPAAPDREAMLSSKLFISNFPAAPMFRALEAKAVLFTPAFNVPALIVVVPV